ncbi:ribonuclease H [Trifolium pratense]|nr:ribonuclease H [Trifolium pratense]
MGVRHVLGTGNYLGLPSMIGRKKKDVFAYIKDRVWKRINSWKGRSLSRAGKEVMIKSVLQAIPSYVMSIYLLPDSIIKDIERMMNSFWWGGGANNKGIRWLAWDRMTLPKSQGGMGFRDLHTFNMAMIAKQGWNIMTRPHTLVAKLFKARWSIGNGASIKIMSEPWLRGEVGAWLPSPQPQGLHNFKVHDLMLHNVKMWDKEKIESIFPLHIANRILEIPLFNSVEEDKLER